MSELDGVVAGGERENSTTIIQNRDFAPARALKLLPLAFAFSAILDILNFKNVSQEFQQRSPNFLS